jgi:cyclopropane fatty-acyl-phospholipid synthase-like methyltransferase
MTQSSLTENAALTSLAHKARWVLAVFWQEIVGAAQDFWKDGHWEKPIHSKDSGNVHSSAAPLPMAKKAAAPPKAAGNLWHAAPGEISEKMWGKGIVTPADDYITDLLIKPLSLTKDMSMLDLAAGLGARMRRATDEFHIYISGREPDPEIAARGMALSVESGHGKHVAITAYDPMNLVESRKYDCIVGRETLYRVTDKKKFIASVIACCKPQVQVSFTDYIVNAESQSQPAILAWKAFEPDADPPSLVQMAEFWAKAGISLRVHDDQTDYYKKEVRNGLIRFAKFMASGVKPDKETKRAIEKRITTWAHRIAAMEQGLKFYRFYGLR